jgi:acid phosphatase (class A)
MNLLFLIFTSVAFANWTKIPSTEFTLPPPPDKGSQTYVQDFVQIKKYQESRSNKECDLAKTQEHPTFAALFGSADLLSEVEQEAAKELVTKVMKFAERVAGYHKDKYKRPRPYDVDSSIEPCAKKPGGAKSYPSSHATSAAAGACVLALAIPSKNEQILEYGDYLGELRVIVGVHHPSDVNAGRSLGRAICDRLENTEDFAKELATLKKQIAKP